MKQERAITVHADTAGLGKLLRLPSPVPEARFAEVPVVAGARDDIGPADKRLFVVARIAAADWPAWEKVLAKPDAPGVYYLAEDVAAGLLPEAWAGEIAPDPNGRGLRLDGPAFKPDSLATSWYSGIYAVKWREYLFLEFMSR